MYDDGWSSGRALRKTARDRRCWLCRYEDQISGIKGIGVYGEVLVVFCLSATCVVGRYGGAELMCIAPGWDPFYFFRLEFLLPIREL